MLKTFIKTRKIVFSLSILLLIGCSSRRKESMETFAAYLYSGDSVFTDIDAEQAHELIRIYGSRINIIDVRRPDEFDSFKIADAVNVNYNDEFFRDSIDLFPRDLICLVYCKYGARSFSAALIMKEMGFLKVFNLSGGIKDWIKTGYPVE